MPLFKSKSAAPAARVNPAPGGAVGVSARPGFEYLAPDQVYLDSACQTLRPQPVLDTLQQHYLTHNACGERVKYAWGHAVDAAVAATREQVLRFLDLPAKRYTTCFTLNTTYAINLLLNQLPAGRYARIVTTHTEHNSVFLPTISFAQTRSVPRVLLERAGDGTLQWADSDLKDAVVVLSAMNNVDGAPTRGLRELVKATQAAGGIVIVDAAQAAPHQVDLLRGLEADAIAFSAHKLYGASLGVVAATNALLESLEVRFIGGGQVATVSSYEFVLIDDLHTRLEAGLQPWAEIEALDTALTWLEGYAKLTGETLEAREERLSGLLYDGLAEAGRAHILSARGSSLITLVPDRVDGHQLAGFLGKGGIMVRSGFFCAHHWLKDVLQIGPAVRFSLGAHNSDEDVARTLELTTRLLKGL